jgi:hypothetical protein
MMYELCSQRISLLSSRILWVVILLTESSKIKVIFSADSCVNDVWALFAENITFIFEDSVSSMTVKVCTVWLNVFTRQRIWLSEKCKLDKFCLKEWNYTWMKQAKSLYRGGIWIFPATESPFSCLYLQTVKHVSTHTYVIFRSSIFFIYEYVYIEGNDPACIYCNVMDPIACHL